jgi:DUF438 domain-containing protein
MSEFINNSEYRKKKLKELIKSLHNGKTVDDVKDEFQKDFGSVSTIEISQIEQELVKEGLAIEEVQRLCDVHASIFTGSISEIHAQKDFTKIIGHPVNVLVEENKAIEDVVNNEILPYVKNLGEKANKSSVLMLRVGFDRLSEIDIHYSRKENLIFPFLEKHGITSPPKVMWGVDDEIRADIKEIVKILSSPKFDTMILEEKVYSTTKKVIDMISKENNILIPLLAETLTFYEWIKIDEATPEIGYCLVKPLKSWKVETPEEIEVKKSKDFTVGEVSFDAGHLTPEEINAMLNTLPLDLTFVDKNDKVKYFTQGKERIFARPKTIIGRDVSMCHPPASVHVVEDIVNDFKSGKKDHEDFWIKAGPAFIYIRYFAVRNSNNEYLGTLEVTQNIKPITELQGEKRMRSEE